MSIQAREYEMSVWKETLAEEGQRIKEKKQVIIGASGMDYLGRARKPKFITKLNGTHTLTFEMPDKYFDSEKGDYIHNEFVDALFAEKKLKFHYKNKWYEFYVKNVSEAKHYKSYMRTYTCTDSFIDELARNGYGITFDEELYNNVEEIGIFSEEILEDSVWEYDAHLNWGDFTEYIEEKLFRIPMVLFDGKLKAHKINYNLAADHQILNIYTGETRAAEMGDDLARENGEFWDSYNGTNSLLENEVLLESTDNAYIYVPYSQLGFCYVSSDEDNGLEEAYAATEYPAEYENRGYAIAPQSIDPNALIQFMFIPKDEKIEIDEAGLILNKNFTYVITVKEWNEQLNSNQFYKFEDYKENGQKKKVLVSEWDEQDYIYGNKAAYYDGYLDEIKDSQALTIEGKKISISDRTEVNISEDIDQFVKVYNNKADEYTELYTSEKWNFDPIRDAAYRVCSKQETRQVVPQLARNFLQNSSKINGTTGWEIMESYLTNTTTKAAKLDFYCTEVENKVELPGQGYSIDIKEVQESFLAFKPAVETAYAYTKRETSRILKSVSNVQYWNAILAPNGKLGANAYTPYQILENDHWNDLSEEDKERLLRARDEINQIVEECEREHQDGTDEIVTGQSERNAIVNFGIIGQEKTIEKGKTYALGINIRSISEETKEKLVIDYDYDTDLSKLFIRIGTGHLIKDGDYQFEENEYFDIPFTVFESNYDSYILIRPNKTYENPYFAIYSVCPYELVDLKLFEAYTKGQDQFDEGLMRYSGRDLFTSYTDKEGEGYFYSMPYEEESLRTLILFEDNVMPGDTYSYTRYFIQQLKLKNEDKAFDTFMAKEYLSAGAPKDSTTLPLSSGQYTEDDYEIITNYIDLNNCSYYNAAAGATEFDCKCGSDSYDKVCLYQKYGICPYRFQTEKHCRRIRTLKGEKSNRFNLTQELGKVFEIYPMYWISHEENGKVMTQAAAAQAGTREVIPGREDWMDKRLFYITEKGKENQLGFRYEKNLQNISRTINSDKIVSKLYVLDVDSQISNTGLCSIKTAEDNPSKDSFIIDFSYYITQGLLDKDKVMADLYGNGSDDLGYLKTLGYFNTQYDILSNKIINLTAASYTELQANLDVNLKGIEAAQKQLRKLEKIMSNYTVDPNKNYSENSTFKSYQTEYIEQNAIYVALIEATFYTDGKCIYENVKPADFFKQEECQSIDEVKKKWLDTHSYIYGILGQFNKEYLQIKEWTKEQSLYLKRINDLSLNFYRKYEPFLKEGTWSDSNYVSDNAYYYGAMDVAKEGAIPKVNYSIDVVDISTIDNTDFYGPTVRGDIPRIKNSYIEDSEIDTTYIGSAAPFDNGFIQEESDYDFEIADTTYVEDIGMFGVNPKTGLPNRLKVLVSALEENPESLKDNKIEVQNFTTQFEDLFQQITASVQTLTFNENIYKRSSNFTSLQTIEKDSLQGALSENQLTLLQTAEKNIEIDGTGQSGSDINNHNNKYKLNGQGLFFSNNGGQSWNTSVGPNGINADLIKTGTLDASKIKIVDGQYIYFAWDKTGITAYRDPQTSNSSDFGDYARFNKFGLSLVEKGQIKLRAGYAFSGDNGKADSEKEINESSNIGFYLYNSEGKPIFSTEAGNDSVQTARLNLTGEMHISDNVSLDVYNGYMYGGTKYNISETVDVYNLGNNSNVIDRIQDVVIEGTEAFYTMPSPQILVELEYAAAIMSYYSDRNLTKITVNGTPFENPVLENTTQIWGKVQYGNNFRYYEASYQTFSSNNGSQNFVRFGSNFKPIGQLGSSESMEKLNSSSGKVFKSFLVDEQSIRGIAYTETSGYHEEININGYKIDDAYYTEFYENKTSRDGQVALYLNNRSDLSSIDNKSQSRLFTSCRFIGGKTQNLMSVLKSGNLYMGGDIQNVNGGSISEESSMPDQVKIVNPYLAIEGGKLRMDFQNIVDINSERNIASFVIEQMGNTSQQIKQDLSDLTHSHYINEQRVNWNENGSYDGINFSDFEITLTHGSDSTTIPFIDFIEMLGLTWGNGYTTSSGITG